MTLERPTKLRSSETTAGHRDTHDGSMPATPTGADTAMLQLVRLVLEDTWSHHAAARRLVQAVDGDRRVLRRIRAKVMRAANNRATELTERAMATLDTALADPRGIRRRG